MPPQILFVASGHGPQNAPFCMVEGNENYGQETINHNMHDILSFYFYSS